MQHDEKLGTGLIHHVVPQKGLAMQNDEKFGTMKLIMLYRQGGPNGYNILILILVPPPYFALRDGRMSRW
jgi:hypothetical protein